MPKRRDLTAEADLTVSHGSTIERRRGRRSRSAFARVSTIGRRSFNRSAAVVRSAFIAAVAAAVARRNVAAAVAVGMAAVAGIGVAMTSAMAAVAGMTAGAEAGQQALATVTGGRTIAASARTVAIAVTALAGNGLVFTAHEGDAEDRDKNRDTE